MGAGTLVLINSGDTSHLIHYDGSEYHAVAQLPADASLRELFRDEGGVTFVAPPTNVGLTYDGERLARIVDLPQSSDIDVVGDLIAFLASSDGAQELVVLRR